MPPIGNQYHSGITVVHRKRTLVADATRTGYSSRVTPDERRTLRCEVESIRQELLDALRHADNLLDDVDDNYKAHGHKARADILAMRARSGWQRVLMVWALWAGEPPPKTKE